MSDVEIHSIQSLASDAINALRNQNMEAAIDNADAVLREQPDHAAALAVRFTALFNSGRQEEARRIGGEAARLNPHSEFILNNQACLQLDANQPAAAAALLKSLIEQYGAQPQWTYNLGLAQRMVGSLHKSITEFQQTIDLNPAHDRAVYQLAAVYRQFGDREMACHQLNYLRLLRPDHALAHSQYMQFAAASGLLKPNDLQHEMRLWGKRFIPAQQRYQIETNKQADNTTVGFLLGEIPLDWWRVIIAPLLEHLAKQVELKVYWHLSSPPAADVAQDPSIEIVSCRGLSDAEFARTVRADELDLLIDVCGMREGNRQRVLGLGIAARQYGWLAHEGMYASKRIGLLEEVLGSERFCFADQASPAIEPDDDNRATEQILFALNCTDGISKQVVEVWARILLELDGWQIHLDADHADIQNELRLRFIKQGISGDRLRFDERMRPGNGSIVMENLACNDVTRAYRALLLGAKVVCLEGELFPAQQSAALLRQAGRAEWVCPDRAAYQQRIVDMASEPDLVGLQVSPVNKDSLTDIAGMADRLVALTRADSGS